MRPTLALLAALALPPVACATVIVNQTPGTGTARWSQLWQDPGPNGNTSDIDSVCWEDFVLASQATVSHLEWWGTGASELGFRIEFWKQDPGTIAYQPYGVFYYGGNESIQPTARRTGMPVVTPEGGVNHYTLDLASAVTLAPNDAVNPRWFIAVIGLTANPSLTWNWSQGNGGSTRTFQWIRGSAPQFRLLGEGRAMVISGSVAPAPCYANCDASTTAPVLNVADFSCFLTRYASGDPYANCDASTVAPVLNVADFSCFLQQYASGCP